MEVKMCSGVGEICCSSGSGEDVEQRLLDSDLDLLKSLSKRGHPITLVQTAQEVVGRHSRSLIARLYLASSLASFGSLLASAGLDQCQYILGQTQEKGIESLEHHFPKGYVYAIMSQLYRSLCEDGKAYEAILKAIEQEPLPIYLALKAELDYQHGSFDAAAYGATKVIEQGLTENYLGIEAKPHLVEMYLVRGDVKLRKGDKTAYADFEQAEKLGGKVPSNKPNNSSESSGEPTRSMPPSFVRELTSGIAGDEYFDREETIDQVLDVLFSEVQTNNVILEGKAGCGKTALVEHIAFLIREGKLKGFEGYKVYATTASNIIAGATYIGETEGRIKELFDFLKGEGKVLLFIDEIHQLIGAGSHNDKPTDITGMLLTEITNPNIRIIGATTPKEGGLLSRNGPFLDRFRWIEMPNMTEELKNKILTSKLNQYSDKGLQFPEDFIEKLEILNKHDPKAKEGIRGMTTLLGCIVSRMERKNISAEEALQEYLKIALNAQVLRFNKKGYQLPDTLAEELLTKNLGGVFGREFDLLDEKVCEIQKAHPGLKKQEEARAQIADFLSSLEGNQKV